MSDSSKAVFLSYAREDSAAVHRIAEALRAAGVEVWFDQNELTGGDQWDQKIRGQIGACALFIPVISVNTQARQEGYFRLEWKLAEDRSHLMVKGKPFIVPVSIDATSERGALVPDAFRAVQWTKLPGGDATSAFIARVQKLLGAPSAAALDEPLAPPTTGASVPPAKSGRVPLWASAALIAGVLALAGYFVLRPVGKEVAVSPQAVAEAKPALTSAPAPVAPLVSDKSIAVLPFANMSDDKESGYFADGVHEDILTNLSTIREFRVVSRTTAMQYRDSKKSVRQIGEELGVRYVLEGTVRRAGNKVRVTGKLLRAANDEPVWGNAFDRELTDIFAIQSTLATEIAGALRAVLSPAEKAAIVQRPTTNVEAYDLLLQARESKNGPVNRHLGRLPEVQNLLEKAVELDPQFTMAWVELSAVRAMRFFTRADRGNPLLRKGAEEALAKAERLAPDSLEVMRARGEFLYRCDRDYFGAAKVWEKIPQLYPNDTEGWYSMAIVYRRLGRWAEALAHFRRVAKMEPAHLRNLDDLYSTLMAVRLYDEARVVARRRVALGTDDGLSYGFALARVTFFATASTQETDEWFARLSPDQLNSPPGIFLRKQWAELRGDKIEAARLVGVSPTGDSDDVPSGLNIAFSLIAAGDIKAAQERLKPLLAVTRQSVERTPDDYLLWTRRAYVEALSGNKAEALASANRAVELVPLTKDAAYGPTPKHARAVVYAWVGEKDRAIAEFRELLQLPYGGNVNVMRTGFLYHPLRGDPRFEALLDDPKNNAPLY